MKNNNILKSNLNLFIIIPLLIFKSIPFFLEPRIWAEEGTIYLRDSLNNGIISIFHSHQGYYSSIPNIIIYISSLFNYKYIPYFTLSISFIFFLIPFIIINNINGKLKNNYIFKFTLGLSVFFILNYFQEIFMNTINIQFITPIILATFFLYDFKSLNKQSLNIIFVLSIICFTNGVLSAFLLPGIIYKFSKSNIEYKKSLLIILICIISYIFLPLFEINSTTKVGIIPRVKTDLAYFYNNYTHLNPVDLLNRYQYFFSIIFFLMTIKLKKWSLSYLILVNFFIILFIDLTKLSEHIESRYLSNISSMFTTSLFVLFNELYNKNIIYIICCSIICICFGRTFFYRNYSYCKECPKWSNEYKKINKNQDAYIHPIHWKIEKLN